MDVLHERCAGVDISKKDAKACVRSPSPSFVPPQPVRELGD